jgi:hypothetical protein
VDVNEKFREFRDVVRKTEFLKYLCGWNNQHKNGSYHHQYSVLSLLQNPNNMGLIQRFAGHGLVLPLTCKLAQGKVALVL